MCVTEPHGRTPYIYPLWGGHEISHGKLLQTRLMADRIEGEIEDEIGFSYTGMYIEFYNSDICQELH